MHELTQIAAFSWGEWWGNWPGRDRENYPMNSRCNLSCCIFFQVAEDTSSGFSETCSLWVLIGRSRVQLCINALVILKYYNIHQIVWGKDAGLFWQMDNPHIRIFRGRAVSCQAAFFFQLTETMGIRNKWQDVRAIWLRRLSLHWSPRLIELIWLARQGFPSSLTTPCASPAPPTLHAQSKRTAIPDRGGMVFGQG